MSSEQPAYRIEATGTGLPFVLQFDTAQEAMHAVNRLRAARAAALVIHDRAGTILTDRQLAVIVMVDRIRLANTNAAAEP